MDIKFKTLERIEGQKNNGDVWVAYKIVGTKIKDGSEWKSGNIFDNKYSRDVLDKAKELEEGEKVNIKLEQNGKYWNVKDVLDYVPQEEYTPNKATSNSSSGSGGFKWNGRTGDAYDRSAAIYLAFDILKTTTAPILETMTVDQIMKGLYALANEIYEYMHNGTVPVSGDDALEPPKV